MLGSQQLDILCRKLGVTESGRKLIDSIRGGSPVRRVGGGRSNVCVRYPSRKMGCIIQAESHTVELVLVYEMEHDPEILEYYDQPTQIKLTYPHPTGRTLAFYHTPDYLAIRENEILFIECKPEEELKKLNEKNPNRYRKNEAGQWICPPGEEASSGYGIHYRVWSSMEADWTFHENIRFLEDYFKERCPDPETVVIKNIESFIQKKKAVSLLELLTCGDFLPDQIYRLIATEHLHVDLRNRPLREPEKVMFFSSPMAKAAYEGFSINPLPDPFHEEALSLSSGDRLSWDGNLWTAINVGGKKVSIQTDSGVCISLPYAHICDLIEKGEMTPVDPVAPKNGSGKILGLLEKTGELALASAMKRLKLIGWVPGEPLPDKPPEGVSKRSFFRWKSQFIQARTEFGDGLQGLVPKESARGNHKAKLPEATLKLMSEIINSHYESPTQISVKATYQRLVLKCEETGIPFPSYKTLHKAIRMRPKEEQVRKRKGNRAAYSFEQTHWRIELATPIHGSRPFEICHIDHTELDIELVASDNMKSIGRPWLTLMIDAFSRRVVGFYLTFDEPSYRSCMIVLRDCVRRFKRLPQTLVLDNGKEFSSVSFEGLLANYEIEKKSRPPAKARFGGVCERFFGKTNTELLYNLAGNTQITKNVRQVTKSVNPKNLAIWTLPELHRVLEKYLFEIYPSLDHPALCDSPQAVFEKHLFLGGEREHRLIPFSEEFRIRTMPTSPKGTGKVNANTGIQVQYIRYWHDSFRNPEVAGQSVPVRYDPEDASVIYAFVKGRWVQCLSDNYGAFKGKSRKEIFFASRELLGKNKTTAQNQKITSGRIARLISETVGTEKTLRQRKRDDEFRLTAQAGGLAPVTGSAGRESQGRPVPKADKDGFSEALKSVQKRKNSTKPLLEDF
ncbi:MAG: DDE-type integrase/transposase/recombinase [Leptospirillum sp.]